MTEQFFPKTSWLGFLVFGTYVFQMIELVFLPVPSSLSTSTMISRRILNRRKATEEIQSKGDYLSDINVILWASIALSALLISFIPSIVFIFPSFYAHLWPVPIHQFLWVRLFSAGLLILGNGLTLMAVLILRRRVTFHGFGETERLITDGLFGIIRNPIVVGMGAIFLGLVLAVPSYVMVSGFILFVLNQNYRVKKEEEYLEGRFGERYVIYKARVGRYFPKMLNINTGEDR